MGIIKAIQIGGKLLRKRKNRATIHGHSDAFLKRTYSGHERAAFKRAARRKRRK